MALHALSEKKTVRFEDGTYDPRTFEVRLRGDPRPLGSIDDVLVDEQGRARYLCLLRKSENRHVLIPVGEAEGDQSSRIVWLSAPSAESFNDLPAYEHDVAAVTPEYEASLWRRYHEATGDDRYYNRADFRATAWGGERGGTDSGRLARLDQLDDYQIARGDPDPRGWEVRAGDGSTVGKVDHLIGDTGSMKVRYLVVALDRAADPRGRRVLVPIGHIALDQTKRRVAVNGLDRISMKTLPEFRGDTISRGEERRLAEWFNRVYSGNRRYVHPSYSDEELYERRIPRSEEELRVDKRERKTGEVGIRKNVETEIARQPVTVHHEEVEVERRPVSRAVSPHEIRDREVRVPIIEEEVVTEKVPTVKEEIVVRKRTVAEQQMVEEPVRREKVEVKREGSAGNRGSS